MKAIEVSATFDENGKISFNELPFIRNKKVKLLILLEEEETDFYALSEKGLGKAYGENEPDYELSLVKEPNAEYKK